MKATDVLAILDGIGIPREEDFITPAGGVQIPLPYMVARKDETTRAADNRRVGIVSVSWTVALFTANRDFALERKILAAMHGVADIETEHFPDGSPYQTNFYFTTKERF